MTTLRKGVLKMSDNNGSDIGAFMAGFVIGGLVGAATALILAPQSGEETRSQIASRGAETSCYLYALRRPGHMGQTMCS
jgi:hypothetical protein